MNQRLWDALIVGGGTAGLSAAQLLGRAGRRTLVIDTGEPRNRFAAHMHGVLGHDGVDPRDLLRRGAAEAQAYGVEIESGRVSDITDAGDMLRVVRENGIVETTRTVIIASGTRDLLPDVPGVADQWGRGVLHCPYCHGFEVAGGRIGVLATGPRAIHQIELVRQWSADLTAFTSAIEPLDEDARARLVARDIRIVASPVTKLQNIDHTTIAVTADGRSHLLDALFTMPTPVIDLTFADGLALTRTEEPGAPVTVDTVGATSHPRVWAAGNVTAPFGNVPVSMAAGSMAGAAVNAALVAEDAARAVAARRGERAATWERRYAESTRVWSGRVNATLAAVTGTLDAGSVLDLGCGEGADAVWLAEQGWRVTGIDVSASAITRARAAAHDRGLDEDRLRFVVGDAQTDLPRDRFDLVVSSFLHSWEEDFPRIGILRAASELVAPGGRMLAISHAAPPPWAREQPAHASEMRAPTEELALLALDPAEWSAERVETVLRETRDPDGNPAVLEDGVLLLRRH